MRRQRRHPKTRDPKEKATAREAVSEGVDAPGATRGTLLDRRGVLVAGAAAATAAVAPELGGSATKALARLQSTPSTGDALSWQPRILHADQARLLSHLCELILPRTATPGANDAGVPEWIDLAVSLAEPEEQLAFLGGLEWIERRARQKLDRPFLELLPEEQVALLREISDEDEEHPSELEAGAAFFTDLKARTLFAYFTSKTGRVQALGLPEKVEREIFHGCTHGTAGDHEA